MDSNSNLSLNSYIEHTLLKQNCVRPDIEKLCEEAINHSFHGVCVPPFFVQAAVQNLSQTPVNVITVVGFPFGYTTMQTKAEETRKAIADGADEVDMVMNVSAFKSGLMSYVKDEIQRIATLCHLQNKLVKVIIETSLLAEEEIMQACAVCSESEADFVKTSTGFAGAGATVEIVELMRKVLPPKIQIKASGGINDAAFAQRLIDAGATRIGTSSALEIINA